MTADPSPPNRACQTGGRLLQFLHRRVGAFLDVEATGGAVLLAAALAALLWANSPVRASYESFWNSTIAVRLGTHGVTLDLRHWVNDGLMTLFFFVVGLEIKRELVDGELRDRRVALVPAVAALGGLVAPVVIYLTIAGRGSGRDGWGIPMATDIAFAVGVLALLGSRVPQSLKVFLLTLAVVDDIGAIVVIAFFYGRGLEAGWLALAGGLVVVVAVLERVGMRSMAVYVAIGCVIWLVTYESGIHPTIAGVVLGLMAPAGARAERLEAALHPWASLVVVPVFALANAGVVLSNDAISGGWSIAGGIVAGLVLGKIVGILVAVWSALRLGVGRMPQAATWRQLSGVAALGGIGFTVSLFVAGLAFSDARRQDQAKIGILAGSVLAALVGSGLIMLAARRTPSPAPDSTQ